MEENKNVIEISKVGECLLVEVGEMENYQNEIRNAMEKLNEQASEIANKAEEKEAQIAVLKAKDDQLIELAAEFEDQMVKDKILEKAGAHREEIEALEKEIADFEHEVGHLEEEFISLDKMNVNAEYGKNILLAFGAKYGFLIKKEKVEEAEEVIEDVPEALEE